MTRRIILSLLLSLLVGGVWYESGWITGLNALLTWMAIIELVLAFWRLHRKVYVKPQNERFAEVVRRVANGEKL